MSTSDGDVSSGNVGIVEQSPATMPDHNRVTNNPVFISTIRPENGVTSFPPPNNLSEKTPGDGGDDNTWKIVVGVLVPLAILIVVIIVVFYIMYRRKYPVRMIIGREFAKIRNPNYNRPLSEATLVREDADIYFSSQRASQVSNPNEFNPVNELLHYDNRGYQRDVEEVAEDEEDSAEKEFRLRKGWLFKRYSQEDKVQIINESQDNDKLVKSSSDSDHGSGSESSDIEAMLSVQKITPIPSRKQKDKENRKSLSNVSVSSKDIQVNVQEDEVKLNSSSYVANKALLRVAGVELIDVKATRSQSLTTESPEVQARPRSFSVDPSKSARRYSARTEAVTKSESDEEIQNFARHYVTASIVEVIVKQNISLYSSISSLPATMKEHAMSFSSVNSNPHLVTDLDDSDSDSKKTTSEKEMDTDVDETDSIIHMKSKNYDGMMTNDLNLPPQEKETAEPVESTQEISHRNVDIASLQYDDNSATTGGSSDHLLAQNTKDQVTIDFLNNCSSETLENIKERDTLNEPDSASFIVLEIKSPADNESTSVEKQELHIITDSDLHSDKAIEIHDDKLIAAMTPNNSERDEGAHYSREQENEQGNMTGTEYGDDGSIVVLNRHLSDQIEGTFQSQSSKRLEHSSNVLDNDHSKTQDTDSVSHEAAPGQKREDDLDVVLEIYPSASLGNPSDSFLSIKLEEPSAFPDVRTSADAIKIINENTGLTESQEKSSHSAENIRYDKTVNQKADFVLESEQTNSSIPSGITISKIYEDKPSELIDSDEQLSSLLRNDHQNTITEKQNDSFIILDSSSSSDAIKVVEIVASDCEQHISHLNAPVEILENSGTNLKNENPKSNPHDQSKHSSKQKDTVSEVIIIEGNDENLSDNSDQESSPSSSSSDGHFEEYSFTDNSKITKYDKCEEIKDTLVSNLNTTEISFVNRRDMNDAEIADVDIVNDSNEQIISLGYKAQDLDHLTSTDKSHKELSQFLQAEKTDNNGSLYEDDSGQSKNKNKSTDENQSYVWSRDKNEHLADKNSETELQDTEKVNFKATTFHKNDGDSSTLSSDVSVDEDISLSDIDDPKDLEPGMSTLNKMDDKIQSLRTFDDSVNESLANLQDIGAQKMTSSDRVSQKEEIVPQPTSQGRLKIIPTVQFSEGSSDSDDEHNGAKPSFNLDSHPLFNPIYKHEDKQMRYEFTFEDIDEALNSDEKTLDTADISLANQKSEHHDLSFSFESAKTFRLGKDNGDDKDNDDIDV